MNVWLNSLFTCCVKLVFVGRDVEHGRRQCVASEENESTIQLTMCYDFYCPETPGSCRLSPSKGKMEGKESIRARCTQRHKKLWIYVWLIGKFGSTDCLRRNGHLTRLVCSRFKQKIWSLVRIGSDRRLSFPQHSMMNFSGDWEKH